MLQFIAKSILSLCGWKVHVEVEIPQKCVMIGAPHTSNWDFPFTILALCAQGIRFNWVAKHTLFRGIVGSVLIRGGGVPVDRSAGTGFVKKIIDLFREREHFILAIAPEGTRSRVTVWKSGFYVIAKKAGVPIVLGSIDYPKRLVRIGCTFTPSDNPDHDFSIVTEYYRGVKGKKEENQSEPLFR